MEDIADFYTYYVIILGVSEDLFWNVDISFLVDVLENKLAYDDYISYVREKELDAMNRKNR